MSKESGPQNPEQKENQITQFHIKKSWDLLSQEQKESIVKGILPYFEDGFKTASEILKRKAEQDKDKDSLKKYTSMSGLRKIIKSGDIRTQIILDEIYAIANQIELTEKEEEKLSKTSEEVQRDLMGLFKQNQKIRQSESNPENPDEPTAPENEKNSNEENIDDIIKDI